MSATMGLDIFRSSPFTHEEIVLVRRVHTNNFWNILWRLGDNNSVAESSVFVQSQQRAESLVVNHTEIFMLYSHMDSLGHFTEMLLE